MDYPVALLDPWAGKLHICISVFYVIYKLKMFDLTALVVCRPADDRCVARVAS